MERIPEHQITWTKVGRGFLADHVIQFAWPGTGENAQRELIQLIVAPQENPEDGWRWALRYAPVDGLKLQQRTGAGIDIAAAKTAAWDAIPEFAETLKPRSKNCGSGPVESELDYC